MIGKFVLIAVVISIVYFVFFKSKPKKSIKKDSDKESEETLLQCPKCSTYMSKKDAFIANGRFFCSKECVVL